MANRVRRAGHRGGGTNSYGEKIRENKSDRIRFVSDNSNFENVKVRLLPVTLRFEVVA